MLVYRNLILDLIALECKRETGYRHPLLYIVTLSNKIKKRRASRELYEEHPCIDIELIERA
jgi:hypothetical protein